MQACQNGHFLRDWPAMKNLADAPNKNNWFPLQLSKEKKKSDSPTNNTLFVNRVYSCFK